MKIEIYQSNELSMQYFRFGNPDGQPLLILPGVAVRSVMLSAQFIEKQYADFAEHFNVYVFDRRADMPEPYRIEDMAEDTMCVLRALHIRNADLYGISQGGMIAQCIAAGNPELVRKTVLCSTAAYVTPSAAGIISEWSRLAACHDIAGLMLSFAEHVYSEDYCTQYRNALLEFGKTVTDEDLRRFRICLDSFASFDMREQLHRIQSPLLVIGAGKDKIFGTEPAKQIAAQTNGEVFVYPAAYHAVYDENPDVMKRVQVFLERT